MAGPSGTQPSRVVAPNSEPRPSKAPDVFVSYASEDFVLAREMGGHLQSGGYSCWMAPDDVSGPKSWAEQIVDAIAGCQVVLVLVSVDSNQSTHVSREVDLAINHGKAILPVRVEDVAPAGALKYLLSLAQWIDVFPGPLGPHAEEVRQRVGAMIESSGGRAPSRPDRRPPQSKPTVQPVAKRQLAAPKRRGLAAWRWVTVGAGGLALIVAAVLMTGSNDEAPAERLAVAGTAVTTSTVAPSTVPPAPVVLSPSVVTVSASSEQPSGDNFAVNVLDGRNDTAWGHCDAGCDPEEDAAADATGVGAFIQFDFEEPQRVVGFTIVNGYDKVVDDANDRWQQNTRVRTMTVTADGGQSQVVTLDDDRSVQEFELEFDQPTGSVRFTVDAVYSGDRWVDVSISEVRLLVLPDTSN